MNEVIIGMIIGFTANIIFVGVRFAGELIGLDMGFGIVNVIDPQLNIQVSILGQFLYVIVQTVNSLYLGATARLK